MNMSKNFIVDLWQRIFPEHPSEKRAHKEIIILMTGLGILVIVILLLAQAGLKH